jgi:hypothetical protein
MVDILYANQGGSPKEQHANLQRLSFSLSYNRRNSLVPQKQSMSPGKAALQRQKPKLQVNSHINASKRSSNSQEPKSVHHLPFPL